MKGARQIEKVEHGPFSAVIRMNDMGVFFCEYGALNFSGTLPKVREWARKTLRELCSIEWKAVIMVQFDNEDMRVNNLRNASNINCFIERFWVAWDGKKWIQCPWVMDQPGSVMCIGPANSEREQGVMPPDELMAQRIAQSAPFRDGPEENVIAWPLIGQFIEDKVYYVPYSEESWRTMLGILERIRELRTSINKLLSTKGGWRVLAGIAANRLLPAPKK